MIIWSLRNKKEFIFVTFLNCALYKLSVWLYTLHIKKHYFINFFAFLKNCWEGIPILLIKSEAAVFRCSAKNIVKTSQRWRKTSQKNYKEARVPGSHFKQNWKLPSIHHSFKGFQASHKLTMGSPSGPTLADAFLI